MAERRLGVVISAILLWLAAFVLFVAGFSLTNDHFDRISRGRQIAQYGELPFRDFFDPGYFMTELSSAAMQVLLGDNLLGEVLLDASFIATGAVLVLLLARRITQSNAIALPAAVLALLSLPRPYDYDKFLFYPLGILLCWRYIDRSTSKNVVILGLGLVAAALFRYDTGVYIACAGLVAISVVHAADWKVLARRVGLLLATIALAGAPVLLFVHRNGGIVNSMHQVATYARREAARTRIVTPPRFSFGKVLVEDAPRARVILIRWAPSADERARADIARRHGLQGGVLQTPADARTWSYVIDDVSPDNLRRLVANPLVEDTHGIERAQAALTPEPIWTRIRRAVPLLGIVAPWLDRNATPFLYYYLLALPLLAPIAMFTAASAGVPAPRPEKARILSLLTICVLLDIFILRDPIAARIGGMAGPAAILSAWLAERAWRARGPVVADRALVLTRTLRVAVCVLLAVVVWSISVTADWDRHVGWDVLSWSRLTSTVHLVATSPPGPAALPNRKLLGLITYLRECTGPDDRVFASWFVPELYFFAQRGFAGGLVVTFGGHWSEPQYQRRMVNTLMSQSVPVAIIHASRYPDFSAEYPSVDEYLRENYRAAGETDFGNHDDGGYRVLVRNDRLPTRIHPASSMPCFR